jgi:hypothetical protein
MDGILPALTNRKSPYQKSPLQAMYIITKVPSQKAQEGVKWWKDIKS